MASERISSYEITTSYETDYGSRGIRSGIAPRNLIFQRTPAGTVRGGGGGGYSMQSSALVSGGGGGFVGTAISGVSNIKSERDREKREMQDLNERFASYIEKVRFLDAQNRKLTAELDKLKAKWGKESTLIKAMYQTEMDEAKRLLDEAEREKGKLEQKVAALEEQLEELRRKLDEARAAVIDSREKLERQNQQLSDYEAEMNLLKRRADLLEGDRVLDKRIIARLQDSLNRARIDLDNETLLRCDAESRRAALEDELEFLRQIQEQELKDLAALACRDTTSENRDLWKSEMGSAMKSLQTEYDEKLDNMRGEMETFYNLKVQEFRTAGGRKNIDVTHSREEITRLKTQLGDLRNKICDCENRNSGLQREIDECRREMTERETEMDNENSRLQSEHAKLCAEKSGIQKEFESIMDLKLSLEMEIAAYRKLLEGEDNCEGLKQVVDTMFDQINNIGSSSYRLEIGGGSGGGGGGGGSGGGSGGGAGGSSWSRGGRAGLVLNGDASLLGGVSEVRGQMSGRTTYSRSARGPIAIVECTQDCIIIENTGRKEEDVSGWSFRRTIDGSDRPAINIPGGTVLKSGAKEKFWARGHRPAGAGANEIETSESSYGQGKDVTTKLCNPNGEDRATHIQKTSFA